MMAITSLISLSCVQVCLCQRLKIYHHDHHKLIVATSLLSLSLWRNISLVATEHGWLPPEGAHRPQGTYPNAWRGKSQAMTMNDDAVERYIIWAVRLSRIGPS